MLINLGKVGGNEVINVASYYGKGNTQVAKTMLPNGKIVSANYKKHRRYETYAYPFEPAIKRVLEKIAMHYYHCPNERQLNRAKKWAEARDFVSDLNNQASIEGWKELEANSISLAEIM